MNKKKIVTIGLVLALTISAVGCSNKTETTEEKVTQTKDGTVVEDNYTTTYTKGYNDYLVGLNQYSVYTTPEQLDVIYENEEYPGNEKYLEDVKSAYRDSREKIQSFVNSLKNDVKTEDADLKKMNEDLIAEGENLISDIDAKLKKLDEIPKDAYNKTKEEFSKVVADTTTLKDSVENKFDQMIKDMNKKLGIETNNNNTNK